MHAVEWSNLLIISCVEERGVRGDFWSKSDSRQQSREQVQYPLSEGPTQ